MRKKNIGLRLFLALVVFLSGFLSLQQSAHSDATMDAQRGVSVNGHAAAPRHHSKRPAAVVIVINNHDDSRDIPLQRLAKAVRAHPTVQLFFVDKSLPYTWRGDLLGGYRIYAFWYDRHTLRFRYEYSDEYNMMRSYKKSIWGAVTPEDLEEIGRQAQTVKSETFYDKLSQLGCRQVFHYQAKGPVQ